MIYKYMYNESKSCPKSFSVCVLLYVVIVEKHSKYLLKFLDDNYILYANILPGFISILRHTDPQQKSHLKIVNIFTFYYQFIIMGPD